MLEQFDEHNITNAGGIITGPGNIHLFGDVSVFYKLQRPINVNSFSQLKLDLVLLKQSVEIHVCLYENKEDALEVNPMLEDEFRCHTISPAQTRINIGESFGYRSTFVNYIRLEQRNGAIDGESILSDIAIEAGEKVNIIRDDGKCNDEKATIFEQAGSQPQCLCDFGFVASNGGKFLGDYDVCVKCLPDRSCAFDGDECASNRECLQGLCENGKCAVGVSLFRFRTHYSMEVLASQSVTDSLFQIEHRLSLLSK